MSDKHLIETFMKARRVGSPFISITTSDQESTIQSLQKVLIERAKETNTVVPIFQHDIVSGWRARNSDANAFLNKAYPEDGQLAITKNPVSMLAEAIKLPERSVLFIINAHHRCHPSETNNFWQALYNLREPFKDNLRSVILLSPQINLPSEINSDFLSLDEKLPSSEQLKNIVLETCSSAQIAIDEEDVQFAVEALRGIASFPAEQAVAMSCLGGLDISSLWDRKRKMISDTRGLRVYEGTEKFDSLGGCNEIKKALTRVIKGKEPPRVIVFIDEGEKVFAGAVGDHGDSTGVSQDFLGTILSYMEDNEADGTIFVGPPGAAKSAIAKTMGNEAGIPTISLDLGGMKGSLLGESESRLRNALKIIDAVGDGRAYFIMTSNKVTNLPPELKRRFTSGTYFFDLPTVEEREVIWKIYIKKYNIEKSQISKVHDLGWTGAEIRNCCRMAYRQNLTLAEASKYIIPVSRSGAHQLEELRVQADGKYLSANYEGEYSIDNIEADRVSTLSKIAKEVAA